MPRPVDLWVSKAVAGRPKDLEFCHALLDVDLLDAEVLADRLANTTATEAKLEVARNLLRNS